MLIIKTTAGKEGCGYEEDISAEETAEKERTRVSEEDEYEERKKRTEEKKVEKEKETFCIKTAVRGLFTDGNLQERSECENPMYLGNKKTLPIFTEEKSRRRRNTSWFSVEKTNSLTTEKHF